MPLRSSPYLGPDRRRNWLSVRWLLLAFAVCAAIVFATLCPIQWRPHLTDDPNQERFLAFAILGFAAKLAFPRKQAWLICAVVTLAIGLEAVQLVIPGRDGRVLDAAVKALGGAFGVQVGELSFFVKRVLAKTADRVLLKQPDVPVFCQSIRDGESYGTKLELAAPEDPSLDGI